MAVEVVRRQFSSDLQKVLFPDNSFYNGCRSDDAAIDCEAVEIPQDENGSTEVLVNPTNFPIQMNTEEDSKKTYPADLLVTRPTVVTWNNQLLTSYDKRGAKLQKHKDSLETSLANRIMYGWGNTVAAFKRATTGGTTRPNTATPGGNAKKIITEADMLWAMTTMNRLNIPVDGRRLVLSADMYEDLLPFKKAYGQGTSYATEVLDKGAMDNIFGFNIYMRSETTKYSAAGAKLAIGAAPAATDGWSALFYHPMHVRYIKGTIKVCIDPYERPDLAGGVSMNVMVRGGGTSGRNSEAGVLTLYQGE
jgi:hypothetical protein